MEPSSSVVVFAQAMTSRAICLGKAVFRAVMVSPRMYSMSWGIFSGKTCRSRARPWNMKVSLRSSTMHVMGTRSSWDHGAFLWFENVG